VIQPDDIDQLFGNIDQIYQSHLKFARNLENRVNSWQESSTLGDLFLQQSGESFKEYTKYINNHPTCVQALLRLSHNNINFMTFLIQREAEHKISLGELLESPLKKLSRSYLFLEELLQYTNPKHLDCEHLGIAISRFKGQIEQHNTENLGRKRSQTIRPKAVTKNTMNLTRIRSKSISSDDIDLDSEKRIAIRNSNFQATSPKDLSLSSHW